MNVLVIPSWYPTSWIPQQGVFFRDQALALDTAGVEVGIVYPDLRTLRRFSWEAPLQNHFQMTDEREMGLPTLRWHGWNAPSRRMRKRLFVEATWRLTKAYVQRFGTPTLVHAHSVRWGGVAGAVVAQRLEVPLVITEHSSTLAAGQVPSWAKDDVKAAFRRADSVIAVSEFLAHRLQAWTGDKPIRVIPNVVDTDFFGLPSAPRPPSPAVILTVAHMQPVKSIDVLIRAFSQAFSEDEGVELAIGGAGEELTALRELAGSLDAKRRIRFLGPLDRDGVRAAMWGARLYASSSQVETFGVALVEALATGLPVVSTRSGGPEEIVFEGGGWLVPTDDVDALAEGLRTGLAQARRGMDEDWIRRQVVIKYGPDAVARAVLVEYERVLAAGRGR